MIKSVSPPGRTSMDPFGVPAGTIAAFAMMLPSFEFSVDTFGYGSPVGHVDRYGSAACGTAVIFKEYAEAVLGMLQALDWIGKSRVLPDVNDGGPKAPWNGCDARVSATRHGVIG